MENLKNFNENEEEKIQDTLTELQGIFDTQIMPTGAVDTEIRDFENIKQQLLNKKITPEEALKKVWGIVYSRQDYH